MSRRQVKAMAMALLCTLPHNSAHRLWSDHKSMLSLPSNVPSGKGGYRLAEKNRVKLIESKLKAYLRFTGNFR